MNLTQAFSFSVGPLVTRDRGLATDVRVGAVLVQQWQLLWGLQHLLLQPPCGPVGASS